MDADAFPRTRPNATYDAWVHALTNTTAPRTTGCSHVYNQQVDPEAYGTSRELVSAVLKGFFDLLWAPATSSRMLYELSHVRSSHAPPSARALTAQGLL